MKSLVDFEKEIYNWPKLQKESVTEFSVINSTLPPTIHPPGTWYRRLSFTVQSVLLSLCLLPVLSSAVLQMDVFAIPADRHKGWYLSLMAPNAKGPEFAWLDPSRLYCNSQVCRLDRMWLKLFRLFLLAHLTHNCTITHAVYLLSRALFAFSAFPPLCIQSRPLQTASKTFSVRSKVTALTWLLA